MSVFSEIGTLLSAGNVPMDETDGNYILIGERREGRKEGEREGRREKSQTKGYRVREEGLVSDMNFNKELKTQIWK